MEAAEGVYEPGVLQDVRGSAGKGIVGRCLQVVQNKS